MTDTVAIALISGAATTIIGLFNGYVILKTHNQSKCNGEKLDENGKKIEVVLTQTNGLQAQLMDAAHAAGRLAEKQNPS